MTEQTDYSTEINDGRNKRSIKCKYCHSGILPPSSASFVTLEFELPTVKQMKDMTTPSMENMNSFWMVDNMYTFDNIGFSNTVDVYKYLSCADCEAGPIGFHNLKSKISYVALSRISHV